VPPIARVLETALYFDDLGAGAAFYRDVIGLRVLDESVRLVAMDAGAGTVLLLFHRGTTASGAAIPGGWIPPHDGAGPAHVAFAIPADALEEWEERLRAHGVAVESRVIWPRGGRSVYFRDPEGHSIELATPGVWAVY
jgi:catechol 2,3-dioxygenase-like lactoylglutathione lyase family enzyme